MQATATITEDLVTGDYEQIHSRKGKTFEVGNQQSTGQRSHQFAILDDDGEVYYRGTIRGDEDGVYVLAEQIWNWGAYDAGATEFLLDGESLFG